jgi:hypothetical protein
MSNIENEYRNTDINFNCSEYAKNLLTTVPENPQKSNHSECYTAQRYELDIFKEKKTDSVLVDSTMVHAKLSQNNTPSPETKESDEKEIVLVSEEDKISKKYHDQLQVELEHQHQSVELIPNVLELFVSHKKRRSSELTPATPKRKRVKVKQHPNPSKKPLKQTIQEKVENEKKRRQLMTLALEKLHQNTKSIPIATFIAPKPESHTELMVNPGKKSKLRGKPLQSVQEKFKTELKRRQLMTLALKKLQKKAKSIPRANLITPKSESQNTETWSAVANNYYKEKYEEILKKFNECEASNYKLLKENFELKQELAAAQGLQKSINGLEHTTEVCLIEQLAIFKNLYYFPLVFCRRTEIKCMPVV